MPRSGSPAEQIKRRTRAAWNGEARHYDITAARALTAAKSAAWSAWLQNLIGRTPMAALDVGTGTGFVALRLAELGHAVTAIDQAERMLAITQRQVVDRDLSVWLARADAEVLPFANDSSDVVISRWLLPEPDHAFAEWIRVLRPGGLLIAVSSLESSARWSRQRAPAKGEMACVEPWRDRTARSQQASSSVATGSVGCSAVEIRRTCRSPLSTKIASMPTVPSSSAAG